MTFKDMPHYLKDEIVRTALHRRNMELLRLLIAFGCGATERCDGRAFM